MPYKKGLTEDSSRGGRRGSRGVRSLVSCQGEFPRLSITRSPRRDLRCLSRSHHRWIETASSGSPRRVGKVVARPVHDEVGPELDLDADDIEQMAITAARTVARGTIADLLERKAALLGPEQPCPTCPRPCAVQREPRAIDFWGGTVTYAEPQCHCPACRRDFFASAGGIRLTSHRLQPLGSPQDRPFRHPRALLPRGSRGRRRIGRGGHQRPATRPHRPRTRRAVAVPAG